MSKIPTRGPLDDSVKLGIPSVTTDPESLRRATIALTRAMEELARQRGDVGRSAVRVNDLVKLGLVSPDIIHTLDPGGAVYLQRGASGFIPEPPSPAPPGGPSEPAEHGHSWNDLTDLPTCFDPCSHEHPWDEIIDKPDCFDPCSHTHSWDDILNPPALSDFDPGCCGVPIRRCPDNVGDEPFWECSENLTQLADLDCCGIIVRECIEGGTNIIRPPIESEDVILAARTDTLGGSSSGRATYYSALAGEIWMSTSTGLKKVDPVTLANLGGTGTFWRSYATDGTILWLSDDQGLGVGYRVDLASAAVLQTTGSFDFAPVLSGGNLVTLYYVGSNNTRLRKRNVLTGAVLAGAENTVTHAPQMEFPRDVGDGLIAYMKAGSSSGQNTELRFFTVDATSLAIVSNVVVGTEGVNGGRLLYSAYAPDSGYLFATRNTSGAGVEGQLFRYDPRTAAWNVIESPLLKASASHCWHIPAIRAIAVVFASPVLSGGHRVVLCDDETGVPFYHQDFDSTVVSGNINQGFGSHAVVGSSYYYPSDTRVNRLDFSALEVTFETIISGGTFECREIVGTEGRVDVTDGNAQAGNPTIDLATVEQAVNGNLVAIDIDAWGRVVGNRAVVTADLPSLVEDPAVYQFFLADNIPYKQFVYAGGLLVTINLYDDAGLTNLRYSKQLVRTGDFLTSIVLTRHPDLAQWTKTLTYNLDDALETVATAAA
jgi:hypothetical protein